MIVGMNRNGDGHLVVEGKAWRDVPGKNWTFARRGFVLKARPSLADWVLSDDRTRARFIGSTPAECLASLRSLVQRVPEL